MDISRIEHLFLKENYLLALNFPGVQEGGILPLRILAREMIQYKYQAVTETNEGARATTGTIAADTQEDSSRLTLATFNLDNILRVTECSHVYQVFIGIKPSAIRQYLYYPFEKSRRNLDVKSIFTKSPYGYIDGFESPYDFPSEQSELWIPKDVDVGFAWHNPLNSAEQIDINIFIVRYLIKVIRDADTVENILKGKLPIRVATLGGIDSFTYDSRNIFNADLIPFDAQREEIEAAIVMK
jgi:hypothetical protein